MGSKVGGHQAPTIGTLHCHLLAIFLIAIVCVVTIADHPVTAHLAALGAFCGTLKRFLEPAWRLVLKQLG